MAILAFFSGQVAASRDLDKNSGLSGVTLAGTPCYGIPPGFGPFDYNDPDARRGGKFGHVAPLTQVERYHFTSDVEQLRGGESGSLVGDLSYTLRAFPNHHRALWSMARYYLALMDKTGSERLLDLERAQSGEPPPECYFQRAKAYSSKDAVVPMVYGIYLHRRGEHDRALVEYQAAEKLSPRHSELVYNMGLLFFDMGRYEEARDYAARAQKLGYPLKGLQRKLDRLDSGSN